MLVAGLEVEVDGDTDPLEERPVAHSELASATAARAALSSTMDAPAAKAVGVQLLMSLRVRAHLSSPRAG